MRLGNTDTELPRRSTDPPAPCHRNMFCPFLKKCFSVPEVCLLIVTKMHCSTDDKVLVLINAQNASGDHLYLCLCHGCHGQLPLSTHVSPHPSYEEVFTEVADQQIHISSFLIKRYWPIFKPRSL